jgi:hypothetical protein
MGKKTTIFETVKRGMKFQFLLSAIIILLPYFLQGQEYPDLPPAVQDTLFLKSPHKAEPLPFIDIPGIRDRITIQPYSGLIFPAFDLTRYLNSEWKIITSSASSFFPTSVGSPALPGMFLPFGGTGSVFSEATFSLNDKMTIGGNSFGIRSPFSPLPGVSGTNRYDIRGATMFMEYKVSKNIRIGAGITVTDTPGIP